MFTNTSLVCYCKFIGIDNILADYVYIQIKHIMINAIFHFFHT